MIENNHLPSLNHLIYLKPQPDFPACDLTDENTSILPEILSNDPAIDAQARSLTDDQKSLYEIAHNALLFNDYPAVHSDVEFEAFTKGFATFEALAMAVKSSPEFDTSFGALKVNWLYIAPGHFADYELSRRMKDWPDERPNIRKVVMEIGHKKGETRNQLRARTIGAQIAFELQRPLLDVA